MMYPMPGGPPPPPGALPQPGMPPHCWATPISPGVQWMYAQGGVYGAPPPVLPAPPTLGSPGVRGRGRGSLGGLMAMNRAGSLPWPAAPSSAAQSSGAWSNLRAVWNWAYWPSETEVPRMSPWRNI